MDLGNLVGALGGLLYAALGVFVVRLRPRTRANDAFGWFAILFGGGHLVAGLLGLALPLWTDAATASLVSRTASGLTYAAATGLLVMVGLRFPAPLSPRERRRVVAPALAGGAYALLGSSGFLFLTPGAFEGWLVAVETLGNLGGIVFLGAELFVLVLLPLRYAVAVDERARRQLALVSLAFALHVGTLLGRFLIARDAPLPATIMTGAAVALVAGAWLLGTRGEGAPLARHVAWAHLAIPLASMVLHTVDLGAGSLGFARGAGFAVLAYAILRHQLLGIDVRLRWTASRSSVAAAFIAVFFVVSEAAAALVGDLTSSSVLGIAAAGALVFVLAPMQRAADRLMGLATPSDAGPPVEGSAERLYRTALRHAWRDGRPSAEDELDLAELAERLGLGARRAEELRQEAARTPPAGAGAATDAAAGEA